MRRLVKGARNTDIGRAAEEVLNGVVKAAEKIEIRLGPPPTPVKFLTNLGEGYYINTQSRRVVGPEGVVPMEHKEYEILALLVENSPRIFTIHEIKDAVWKRAATEATIKTTITKLRTRFPGPEVPGMVHWLIDNRRNVGYYAALPVPVVSEEG